MHERKLDQSDPDIDTIANLHRSIKEILAYCLGRSSVAELFGLQTYLSKLASQLAPVHAARFDLPEMPPALRHQMEEIARQNRMQHEMLQGTPAQYRQES